jgi:phosphoglycolate phosphatase-like HAD superfamily hydrolase
VSSKLKLRAIVFDFDGVILESGDVKTQAFIELFAEHGSEVQERVRNHHLDNLGVSRFKKFSWIHENVLRTPLSEEASKALGDRFSALALEKVMTSPFVAGAREALHTLAPRFPLFVASGTPQSELDLIVGRRELGSCFREIHGTPCEKPEILRSIMQRHGFAPSELLFIGDGTSDHAAAVATGVEFLARDTTPMTEHWRKLGVALRPDLTDLPAVVEEW